MKRLILIFAILISVVGVLIMASPMLLRLTGLDEPVKSYILSKVMKDEQGSVDLDEFRIGLGTLELNNVFIEAQNKRYALSMPIIRFDFHFHDFFLNPTNPQVAIKSVSIIEPVLILSKSDINSTESSQGNNKLDSLIYRLNRIEGIEKVLLEKGAVFYRTSARDSLPFLTDIEGQVSLKQLNQIQVAAHASFLSTQKANCKLNAALDLAEMYLDARIQLLNYKADETILPASLKKLKLENGFINGKIAVEMRALSPDSIWMNGQLDVSNLTASFDELQLHETQSSIVFDQQVFRIQDGRGTLNGSEFRFHTLDNPIFGSDLQAEIQFPSLSLANLISPNLDKDILNFSAVLDYNKLNKKIVAKLTAERSEIVPDLDMSNLKAKVTFSNGKLTLNNSYALIRHAQINATGAWDLHEEKLSLQLMASQESGEHIMLDRLSDKLHNLQISLGLDTRTSQLKGKWDYLIASTGDSLLEMSGRLNGQSDAFEVELLRSNYPSTQAFVRFVNVISNPEIERGQLTNFPLTAFMNETFVKNPLDRFNTDIRVRGQFDNLSTKVTFIDKQNEQNDFRLSANIRDILQANKQVKGAIEIKNLMGFYDFKLREGILNGLFDFPSGIKGDVQLDLINKGQLSGGFEMNDFCISAALSDTVLTNEVLLQNQLSGKIELGGTITDPEISAQVNAERFVFNDKGYYQAEMSVRADEKQLLVDSIKVSLNNLAFIEGNFIARFADRNLSGNFSGNGMDVSKILETINPGPQNLTGTATYAMSLGGTFDNPKLAASGRIENGVLFRTGFSHLDFEFTDTIRNLGKFYDLSDHQIAFSEISLVGEGEYSLSAVGNFPLDENLPLDVDFHFKGDALKFLPDWVNFFEGGTSITDIHLGLEGSRSQLKVKSGFCQIDRGELWMKAVAPHIEDIHGTIELEEGTNKVNIKNLKASVDGQEVTFNTVRNIAPSTSRKLENWYFRTLDLDFGILSIVTDKGGVELNIPGLMRKKESGHLFLSGKSDQETFYFAGPVKHPTAYGTLTLYNAWLTYPFILPTQKVKTNKRDIAVEFLKNMEWDVKLISGKDVRYRREIPAYIDNVNTELYVDESSPGLDFSGILSEGTFRPIGKLNSSRGRLEYLDQSFKVDFFSVEFTEWDLYPLISGRAWTTIRDSVGAVPKTIYLRLYDVDEETNSEKAQGSLENFRFKLESADPQIGEDQEQVLSYMGFSVTNLKDKATSVGGAITERYLFRPLLRPLERALEQRLGVDMVRINSNIAKNLFYSSFGYNAESNLFFNPFTSNASYLFLMQSSDITIGKYISKDIFLTYTGQLVSVYNQNEPELDFNHSFGVEYRFLRNVLVEFEYDRELMRYYRLSNQKQYMDDFKIRLRHSFTF